MHVALPVRCKCLTTTTLVTLAACAVLAASLMPSLPAQSTRIDAAPYRKRSSAALAITPDGATIVAVNPDSNSVTLVDAASRSVVTELAVGLDPRTVAIDDSGQRAYVANRVGDSLSVIDLTTPHVITEVAVGNRPYGVVVNPDGDCVYVAEQGSHRLRTLDAQTLDTTDLITTAERPSGLAISTDGRTLYVTHLLTNTITVLNVRPYFVYLPLIAKGTPASQPITLPHPASNFHAKRPTSSIHLYPTSNLVQSIVIAPDGPRAYVPHTRSNTQNQNLTFDSTVSPLVSSIDLTTRQHLTGQQIDLGTLDRPGVGLPFDAALTPGGDEIWVVNAASNDISVVDLISRTLTAHIEVGDNPRGIVLSPDGATAYVNNTLAGTISVIDTAAYTVTDVITITHIPLPPILLNGKRLFHSSDDPRVSLNQWISCNTCHFEGEHDGRTWALAFAGPRNTTSLLGMIETYPLRWSGEWNESADSEFANRKENFGSGLIEGEMNCSLAPPDCVAHPPNQGRSYDLDSLALFIDALAMPLSPAHTRGEPLSDAEQRGQALFDDPALGCVTCHPPPLYTDQLQHDVGTATLDERIGPAYDTPTLRGLYNSAPYFHDGSAATLRDALTRPNAGNEHNVLGLLTEPELQDLIAFLMALPFHQ